MTALAGLISSPWLTGVDPRNTQKALPGGQVLTGSRGKVISNNNAVIFRYDGKLLTPVVACSSGATATGYPSFAWEDGHLWMAFVSFNYGHKGQAYKRGLITVAKFKWPIVSK